MFRYKQYILLLRETVSSFTLTVITINEKHYTLHDALITLFAEVKSLRDGGINIHIGCAPGLQALSKDQTLSSHGITPNMGNPKNPNKNPVAEQYIEELH